MLTAAGSFTLLAPRHRASRTAKQARPFGPSARQRSRHARAAPDQRAAHRESRRKSAATASAAATDRTAARARTPHCAAHAPRPPAFNSGVEGARERAVGGFSSGASKTGNSGATVWCRDGSATRASASKRWSPSPPQTLPSARSAGSKTLRGVVLPFQSSCIISLSDRGLSRDESHTRI